MIYLIGGSPRCGKTTVAKKLALKSHTPWFPADYLASAVSQYISEEERADKFPLSNIRKQNNSNDFLYSNYSPSEIVKFYDIQAETAWLGLKAFIEYSVHDKQDFILEGYQIQPKLLSQLDKETQKNIRPAFLYKKDKLDIEASMKKGTESGDWLIAHTKKESTFAKVAEMVSIFGDKTAIEAKECNMPLFNMDGDFDKKVEEVVNTLQILTT